MAKRRFTWCLRVAVVAAIAVLPAGCRSSAPTAGGVVLRPDVRHGRRWQIPRATRLPPGRVLVPLEIVGDHPFVEVRINGRGPYRMLLDTGAGDLRLTPQVVEALGLPHDELVVKDEPPNPQTGVPGLKEVFALGHLVQSLEIGAARFERIHAVKEDFAQFGAALGRLDGIVGLSVFRDCQLTLDYPAREARIGFGRLPPPDGRDVIPIQVLDRGGYALTFLKIGGRRLPFLIDSGSNGGLTIPASLARRRDFAFGPVPYPSPVITVYGTMQRKTGRLRRDLRLGRHTLASPVVDVVPETRFTSGEGILGGEVLRHFAVTINQKSRAVRLDRNGRGPIASPPVRHLGARFRVERDAWVVTGAGAGASLEQLGLREADRILAIDGRPISGYLGPALPPEGSATCTVERDGERFDLALPVTTVVP